MSKKKIIAAISDEANLTSTQSNVVYEAVINTIQQSLLQGEAITVPGLGTFTTKNRNERNGRNPATGGAIVIPACTVPVFRPSAELKRMVNESKQNKESFNG